MWSEVKKTAEVIEHGGIILYPTDTIWGIGCHAQTEEAILKIYRLKKRSDSKNLIILLAEAKDVFQYVANPHPDVISLIQSFDRPTTVIYDQAINLPDSLIGKDGSIAIRVTKDPFCKALIKKIKGPLISTSANVSGHPSPGNFSMVNEEIKSGVDYVVAYRQEEETFPQASRIVRISQDGHLEVIRT